MILKLDSMRIKERFNKKLFVEGNDDQHVIWALCQRFNIHENFDVVDTEGIDNLLIQIPVRLKQAGITTIGVIIDADNNIQSRWISISQTFVQQGFNFPEVLPNEGLIINQNNIRISIWVMPNNNTNGVLEDFISFLIPNEDQLIEIVKDNLNNIEQQNLNKYQILHKPKALVHSWLALQEDPGTPLGLAITKRYLTTKEETCSRLVDWLTSTFT